MHCKACAEGGTPIKNEIDIIAALILLTIALFILSLPPIIATTSRRAWTSLTRTLERKLAITCALLVLLSFTGALTSWRLRGYWPQTIGNLIAYLASCLLVGMAFHSTRQRLLQRSTAIVLHLCFLCGFTRKEITEDDTYREQSLSTHVKVRYSSGGWFGIDWEGVAIVDQPYWLPPIEHVIYRKHIGDDDQCNEQSILVLKEANQATVQCGATLIDTLPLP